MSASSSSSSSSSLSLSLSESSENFDYLVPFISKDEHTVFFTDLRNTTEEQLDKAIEIFFRNCTERIKEKIEQEKTGSRDKYNDISLYSQYVDFSKWSKWYINVVKGREGYIGVSYVYFQNPAAFFVLLGRNPDGSPRFKVVNQEDLECDEDIDCWDIPEIDKLKADIPEGKVLAIDSQRMVPFPDIENDEDTVIPEIKQCVVILKPEKYNGMILNQLFSHLFESDKWVTEEMIREQFVPFCSCKQSRNSLEVNIVGEKVYVKFSPNFDDSHFALKMRQKIEIKFENKKCTLFFDYRKKNVYSESNRGRGSSRSNSRGYKRGGYNQKGDIEFKNWRSNQKY